MKHRKLVIWDQAWAPYAQQFISRLDSQWTVSVGDDDHSWLLAEIEDATALVALTLSKEALHRARNLEVFLYPGAGLAQTDPAAFPLGCRVVNVYEHETAVAEYVFAVMLAHATGLFATVENFRYGDWKGSGRLGGEPHVELYGRTVGLFGYGRIGRAVAARARAFGMRVVAVSRQDASHLPKLLQQSDFFVIAAPLNDSTRGRIGAAELALLPPHAFLVNVARAEIVDELALYEALRSRSLGGAALDVWYQYPRPGANGYGSRLPFHELTNLICTPHYSAWTLPMIQRRIARMTETLNQLAAGEELDRVVVVGEWRP